MEWFARAMQLNRHHGYSRLRYGMCLDWLGRSAEAGPWYDQADALDPRGYFTAAHVGWHYMQVQNYPAAKAWFERSLQLGWIDNDLSTTYLGLAQRRMQEAATNRFRLPPLRGSAASPPSAARAAE
jgi:tetratricopeptide (TPR) repeat protein